jgi:hypothetical protein
VSELLLDMQHYLEDLEIDGTLALCRPGLRAIEPSCTSSARAQTSSTSATLPQARPLSCSVL